MNPDLQKQINGEMGDEAQEEALREMVRAIIEHSFDCVRVNTDAQTAYLRGLITKP
jgi:N-acetylglutamate synthase/N-acetylornithine aminotransferase